MSNRDKLIAQAEALEWADKQWAFGQPMSNISRRIAELRALAEQQPEAVEPVGVVPKAGHCILHIPQSTPCALAGYCLNANPQASAPAAHNQDLGVHHAAPDAPADDLNALVAQIVEESRSDWQRARIEIIAQAITDLRAQLADKDAVQGTFESYAQIVAEHSANITRLEAENAELEKKAKNANADADIYAKAWQRELGRWMGNKRHHIDACVLGTQTLVADNAKARELLSMMLRWQEIGLSQFDLSEQSATGTRLAVVRAFLAKQGDTP